MSSKNRKHLIKTANLLEKTAVTLVDILVVVVVVLAETLAASVEFAISGKAKRVKAPKRAPKRRQMRQQTIIYRQVIPRAAIINRNQEQQL